MFKYNENDEACRITNMLTSTHESGTAHCVLNSQERNFLAL